MKTHKRLWIALAGFSCCGICLLACAGIIWVTGIGPAVYETFLFNQQVKIGSTAPDFELPTLDGGSIRLSSFRGQPRLINFGATWCPDCKNELPILTRLHEQHPELVIISIDLREDEETVLGYASYHDLKYPVALDLQGKVGDLYHVYAIPTVLFIDKNGVIQGRALETLTEETITESLSAIGIKP